MIPWGAVRLLSSSLSDRFWWAFLATRPFVRVRTFLRLFSRIRSVFARFWPFWCALVLFLRTCLSNSARSGSPRSRYGVPYSGWGAPGRTRALCGGNRAEVSGNGPADTMRPESGAPSVANPKRVRLTAVPAPGRFELRTASLTSEEVHTRGAAPDC